MVDSKELLGCAQAYHDLGVPVVPFIITRKENGVFDKKPTVPWAKWMTEPQTDDEFNGLPWSTSNGLGVILGTPAKSGLYLCAVDYDSKGINDEIKTKGKEIVSAFRCTATEQTVNDGLHLFYWSRKPCKTEGSFHDVSGIELLGEKKLCVVAPSEGYRKQNDNMPTELESLEDDFFEIMAKYGFKLSEETELEHQQDVYGFQITKLVDLSKLKKIGAYEYEGPHPFHDSTTERNFAVNIKTNEWHCFRHDSGGGALQYLAMREGLIKCEQAKKGALRGQRFKDVLNIAVAQDLIDSSVLQQSEINPIILAKDILEDYRFVDDADFKNVYFYDKDEGVYSEKVEELLTREIVKRLDKNFKKHYYDEIFEFIKGSVPCVPLNVISPEIVAVKNGLLNVKTRELKPFDPSIYITNKLPIKYDPTAKCPAILKFLDEVVGAEEKKIVCEMIGYCLFRSMIIHKAFLFVGEGANGKSTLLDLITTFLGKNNVSSEPLQSLCFNRFSAAQLNGKMANICADIPSNALTQTGMFKMLTGNDMIRAEQKFKNPFDFVNIAKLLFSANQVPETKDETLAFFRRWIIIACPNLFVGEKRNPNILQTLTTETELSGLLNWAIDGLKQLLERGCFETSENIDSLRKEYIRKSNSAKAYIEERLAYDNDPKAIISKQELYRDYALFCQEQKLSTLPKQTLTSTMYQVLPAVKDTKERLGPEKKSVEVWQYLRRREQTESMDNFTEKSVPSVPSALIPPSPEHDFEKNKIQNSLNEVEGTKGTTFRECWLCLKPLPSDLRDTTTYDGKVVHMVCYLKLKEGLKHDD